MRVVVSRGCFLPCICFSGVEWWMPRVRIEKHLPPFLASILRFFRGYLWFASSGNWGFLALGALFPSFRAEGFWFHWQLLYFCAEGFDSCLLKKAGAPWSWTCCTFCAEGFLVWTFWKVEAPWHLVCTCCVFWCRRFFGWTFWKVEAHWRLVFTCCAFWCRRFFASDLLKSRSPLAFGLHLLCVWVPKVFWFGPFNRSKPLGLCLDKYAKFADFAYFANLLF